MPRQTPMQMALQEAARAAAVGEVPVGAVVLDAQGRVLARAHNANRRLNDPTAHAECLALRAAAAACGSARLDGCDIYVTLEPCAMCAGAIAEAHIKRLYYGAADAKRGAVDHGVRLFAQASCHHRPEVYGGLEERAAQTLLQDFFRARRS